MAVLALLLLCCRHHPSPPPRAWVWPGANPHNTMLLSQSGTSRRGRMLYRHQWDAEAFESCGFELPAAVAMEAQGLMLADIDADGRLELLVGPAGLAPECVLSSDGLPFNGPGRGGAGDRVLLADAGRAGILGPCCVDDPGLVCWSVRLNGRTIQVRPFSRARADPDGPSHGIFVCDSAGQESWRHATAPRLALAAAVDLTADGRTELLFGSYSEEHGWRANGTTDHDSTYCFCFDDSGRLVWQRGFGAWLFAGCRPAVADLDGDGRLEVVVACHTWNNTGGGLFVLDAATGRVIASAAAGRSFGSVGCADLDGDGSIEVVAVHSGITAGVGVYRFESETLRPMRSMVTGRAIADGDARLCRLDALCDLDGDGRVEIVVSESRQQLICPDPQFYPSRFVSSRLAILSAELKPLQYLPLPCRPTAVAAGDIIPGGDIELVVLTDRLSLYSSDITASER